MLPIPKEKRVTPEQAIQLLAAQGKQLNREEAERLLEFLYEMAYLDFKHQSYENSGSIHQGKHRRAGG